MINSVTHSHWRVTVETSGEQIVAIEPEMLAGRETSEADEDAIRTAAHHLLAFIGDPAPAPNVLPPVTAGQGVVVKPLEWKREGWVEAFAHPEGLGVWYSISPEKPIRGPGKPPFKCRVLWGVPGNTEQFCFGTDFPSVEVAKAVAQADYEQRIRSALAHQPLSVPDGWQPIETAPRDGTEILGYGHAAYHGAKYAKAKHIVWWNGREWCGRDPDPDVTMHPYSWQPLPAAPKYTGGGGTE